MKKMIFAAAVVAVIGMSSCSSIHHTAATENVDTELYNRTTADLDVADKTISYTFEPTKAHQRAGMKSMKSAAITKALEANGGGDLIVAPQFEIKQRRGLFGTKVKSITVKGHPASYKKFHPTTKAEAEVISALKGWNK